jgi:hypothetical protein
MKSRFLALVALTAFGWLTPAAARADFVVQVAENGGAWTTVASSSSSSGTLSFSGTYGDFSILGGFSSSNSPGALSGALTEVGTFSIINKATGAGSNTLSIRVSAQDFTTPSGTGTGLVLAGTVSGSVAVGNLTSGDFTASIGKDNFLWQASTSTPTITFGPTSNQQSFSGDSAAGVDIATTPYSMTLVGDWTLSNGGKLTLTGGNGAVLVPEPASMSMLTVGGGILGAVSLFRRRKSKACLS